MWSFSLIWPAVLEKMFEGFKVNSIWPPNHVTYQYEINKLEKGRHGECVCKVSPQSVQPFWRRRFFLFYFKFKTRWLPNQVTYDVIIYFFCSELLCRWGSRNFRFFRCSVILDEFSPGCRFTDDITKNHPCSRCGVH